MKPADTQYQIQEELLLAKQSRKEGNEGRARVCARRAAGAAVQLFLSQEDNRKQTDNTFQSLRTFRGREHLPDRVHLAVCRLTQRVNQDYQLPAEVDLIEEAGIVINYLGLDDPDN
jgi:hypothetical protein